jgi:hypothetical protein
VSVWWRQRLAAYDQGTGGGGGGGTLPIIPANRASTFADQVGINAHWNFANTAYEAGGLTVATDRAITIMDQLGIKHFREKQVYKSSFQRSIWLQLYKQLGVRVSAISGDRQGGGGTVQEQVDEATTYYGGPDDGAIEQYEGWNEINLPADKVPTDWVADPKVRQQALWNYANPKGYHILAPSLGSRVGYQTMGDFTPWCHQGNTHAYQGGLIPSSRLDDTVANEQKYVTPGMTVQMTECGYMNAMKNTANGHPPTPEDVSGLYMPRLFAEQFIRPKITRAYSYELVDQHPNTALNNLEDHFGVYRVDWTPKPAALAIGNLMHLLEEPSPSTKFNPAGLGFVVTGDSVTRKTLLQKSNGYSYILIWRDVSYWNPVVYPPDGTYATPAKVACKVDLGTAATVKVYRPSTQAASVNTLTNVTQVNLQMAGELVVLEVLP